VIEVWNLATRTRTLTFPQDEDSASQIGFSPDGNLLVTAHQRSIKLRSVSKDRNSTIVLEHLSGPFTISPDGRIMAALRRDREAVELWDLAQNRSLGSLKMRWQITDVPAGAFSPDGHLFAAPTGQGRIEIWDVDAKEPKRHLRHPGPTISTLMFAPDGRTLVASTQDAVVLFWNTSTWEELFREVNYAHSLASALAIFSANGEWLAFRGHRLPDGNESVLLWHAPSLGEIDAAEAAQAAINKRLLSEDLK